MISLLLTPVTFISWKYYGNGLDWKSKIVASKDTRVWVFRWVAQFDKQFFFLKKRKEINVYFYIVKEKKDPHNFRLS